MKRLMIISFYAMLLFNLKSYAYSSFSPYSYCCGNPVNYTDPTGMKVNATLLKQTDELIGSSTTNSIINDLIPQTGLEISLDDENKMQFAKNHLGEPIVSEIINKNGEITQAGSAIAREFMIKMINSEDEINVMYGPTCMTDENDIGINPEQINAMIEGAVGVDGNTLGFGMTFLHELYHTSVGGSNKDTTKDFGTGTVVDIMNQIRKELNEQGFNYGERMNYKAISRPEGSVTPFNRSALKSVMFGTPLTRDAKYILIK